MSQYGELGVKYWCFGEFRCGHCNRTWESSKAWRDFGQECEKCLATIQAHDLQPLAHYSCTDCKKLWKSKRVPEGQPCRSCKKLSPPITHQKFKQQREFWLAESLSAGGAGVIDQTKQHKRELCEKCLALGGGRFCYDYPDTDLPKGPPKPKQYVNGVGVNIVPRPPKPGAGGGGGAGGRGGAAAGSGATNPPGAANREVNQPTTSNQVDSSWTVTASRRIQRQQRQAAQQSRLEEMANLDARIPAAIAVVNQPLDNSTNTRTHSTFSYSSQPGAGPGTSISDADWPDLNSASDWTSATSTATSHKTQGHHESKALQSSYFEEYKDLRLEESSNACAWGETPKRALPQLNEAIIASIENQESKMTRFKVPAKQTDVVRTKAATTTTTHVSAPSSSQSARGAAWTSHTETESETKTVTRSITEFRSSRSTNSSASTSSSKSTNCQQSRTARTAPAPVPSSSSRSATSAATSKPKPLGVDDDAKSRAPVVQDEYHAARNGINFGFLFGFGAVILVGFTIARLMEK